MLRRSILGFLPGCPGWSSVRPGWCGEPGWLTQLDYQVNKPHSSSWPCLPLVYKDRSKFHCSDGKSPCSILNGQSSFRREHPEPDLAPVSVSLLFTFQLLEPGLSPLLSPVILPGEILIVLQLNGRGLVLFLPGTLPPGLPPRLLKSFAVIPIYSCLNLHGLSPRQTDDPVFRYSSLVVSRRATHDNVKPPGFNTW